MILYHSTINIQQRQIIASFRIQKMLLRLRSPFLKSLKNGNPLTYSYSDQEDSSKVETVSFKKNVVNNFHKISYQSEEVLPFRNGKCLIYKNHRSILTVVKNNAIFWIPTAAMTFLVYSNPLATTLPVSTLIFALIDFIILKLWSKQVQKNQNMIKEIYLLENGQATEIWFENKYKRKLFGQEEKKVYYNSVFTNPDFEKEQIILLNKQARVFPASIEEVKDKQHGYAWVKYFTNGENFLIIPKKAEFLNMKVLIQVFNGRIIRNKVS